MRDTEEIVVVQSKMEAAPDEVLEQIFSSLSLDQLTVLEGVSVRWSEVIVRRFFHPYLTRSDYSVMCQLATAGWSRDKPDNYEVNKRMFRKVTAELPLAWGQGLPRRREWELGSYRPGVDSGGRVTSTAIYRNKLYVGRETCAVEVRLKFGLES